MFQIENPRVLAAVFLVFPAVLFTFLHFKKLSAALSAFYHNSAGSGIYRNIRLRFILKAFFRVLAWICAVLAFAGISWGSRNVPVPKNGNTVCFVFDVSWSMLARDCPEKMTRLDSAKLYAANLLPLIPQSSFSAVLAKGDGFEAIPETDDSVSILTLLENLNPNIVSAPGSSIGRGIQAALNSLPLNSAKMNYIWVFTDGDETDSLLKQALADAASAGIPVTLVGFGRESETEITAGDGKTKVKTSLKAEKMKKLAEEANKKSFLPGKDLIRYIPAAENSSAYLLINQIKARNPQDNGDFFTYEVVPVKKHLLFIFLALLFLMLSFAAAELNINGTKLRKSKKAKMKGITVFMLFLSLLLSSCSFKSHKEILKGAWNFYQQNYRSSMARFLELSINDEDSMAHQYALFGLASTYIAVGEYDSALERLSRIEIGTAAVPDELESAVYYNEGIIFERKNDFIQAAECFKKAILSNPDYLEAKINLELCSRSLAEKNAREAETQMQKISEIKKNEPSQMQNEIFNIIRENESKQWKQSKQTSPENDVLDY